MTVDDFKNAFQKWVAKKGTRLALKELVGADITVAVAQKLVTNRYTHTMNMQKALAIIELMEKDGISVWARRRVS